MSPICVIIIEDRLGFWYYRETIQWGKTGIIPFNLGVPITGDNFK